MANKPTNQGGDPSKQLKSSLDTQQQKLDAISTLAQDQLLVLKDILDVVKNIADNMVAGLRAQNVIYAVQPDANRLAEAEKEREANRQNIPAKDDPFKSLKGIFDGLKKGFDFVRVLLIPMLLGFLIGFRKKFDLLTIAIGFAILRPITALKLIYNLFKNIISFAKNLGPNIEYARRQLSIGFSKLANAFNRSTITKLANQLLSGVKGFFSNLISRFANATGITKQLERFSKFLFNVKTLFNSMTAPITDVMRAKTALGKFGEKIQSIGNSFNKMRATLTPPFNRFMGAIDATKNFFLGIGQRISSIFSKVMTFIKPVTDFLKSIFEPISKLLGSGSGAGAFMKSPAMKFLFKIAGKGLKAVPVLGQIIMVAQGIMGLFTGGMKGFEEGGVIGAIKGALSGLVDGLFGWIFDLVGWVAGLLGFEEAEKALEEYGLGELVNDLLGFIFDPIEKTFGIIGDMFSGKIGIFEGGMKLFANALDGIIAFPKFLLEATAGIFEFDAIAEILREFSFEDLFGQLWGAIEGWIDDAIGWLGIGGDSEQEKAEKAEELKAEKQDAIAKAKESGATEEEIKAIQEAKSTDDLEKVLFEQEISGIKSSFGLQPTPASPQQVNQQKLNEATEQNQNLAAAPKQTPPASSPTTIAVDKSNKQAVTYNRELHAKRRSMPDGSVQPNW